MIKRYQYIAFICLFIVGLTIYLKRSGHESSIPQVLSKKLSPEIDRKIDFQNIKIDGKRVIGLQPGNEKQQLEKLKVDNYVSDEWEPNLEKALRAQGGDSIKSLSIRKLDSLVWAHNGLALYAESVVVTLQNENKVETTFRALVDAQTGKILETWDRPIFDSIHPKDNFKVKIDPRYHSE